MTANGNGLAEWTFAMVDLAGFTALTEAHGDAEAADLAINFSEWPAADSRRVTGWSSRSATSRCSPAARRNPASRWSPAF